MNQATDLALDLRRWTPVRFYWRQAQPFVDWAQTEGVRFTDPFFEQTIAHCLQHPCNLLFRPQTPVELLGALAAERPGLKPDGFIFHLSRCGSTVVSRMLAALPQNIVISEAQTIDSILRTRFYNPTVTNEQQIDWLRWLISALGQRRAGVEQHYFIKFDGWHAFALPLIRRAFPDVPCVFIYREPLAVMVSHGRQVTSWMMPGTLPPQLLGLDINSVQSLSLEEYCARMLAQICAAAIEQARVAPLLLVNHNELPSVVSDKLLDYFGVAYTPAELARMRETTAFHAKLPGLPYVDDRTAKSGAASAEVRRLAAQWVSPRYEELESMRRFKRV
jgi:hypothetical protein